MRGGSFLEVENSYTCSDLNFVLVYQSISLNLFQTNGSPFISYTHLMLHFVYQLP